jgi:hypothetical protein
MKIMKSSKLFRALILVAYGLLFLPPNLNAQNNALTINGAYILMNGGTETENINLVINQSSTLGIVRLSEGGHIHSESQDNTIKWITNSALGSYVFPFGVLGNTNDYIPFTFNKTAGSSSVSVSTWSTNQENSPKPHTSNVAPVINMLGTADSVIYALDRFWNIQAPATTADLTFSYLGAENTTVNANNNLIAQHWNGASWNQQVGSTTTTGVTTGVGTSGPYLGQNTFSPWMLTTQCSPDITVVTVAETITANAIATYQWIDCNNNNAIIAGETGQSYTATANGDYAVIVTDGGCSDTSACINISTVGVKLNSIENTIAVYPNPASDKVNVVFDKLDPTTQLQLIDNLGKTIHQIKPINKFSIIDIQSLPKGIYTLIISTLEDTTTKKIIKQ